MCVPPAFVAKTPPFPCGHQVVLYLVADTLTGMASVMDEVKEVSEQFLPPHMRKKIKDRRDKIAKKDKKESKKEAKAGKAKTDGGKKAKKEAKAAAKKEEEKAMVSEAVAEAEADKKAEKKKKKRKKERVIDPHAAFHDMPGMVQPWATRTAHLCRHSPPRPPAPSKRQRRKLRVPGARCCSF